MRLPETRYAKKCDSHVAFQLFGDGTPDLILLTQWLSHVEAQWDVPPLTALLEQLGAFSGTGLSDPVPIASLPPIEEWMDDLGAVMDACGLDRAAIVANLASTFMADVVAATYPDRVSALVLVNAYPRLSQAPDYPWGDRPTNPRASSTASPLGGGGGGPPMQTCRVVKSRGTSRWSG